MLINKNPMTSFAVIDPETGCIISIGRTDVDSLSGLTHDARYDIEAPIPGGIFDHTHYWSGHSFAPLPPKPGPAFIWTGSQWIDPRTPEDIQAEADALWADLRAKRDRLLAASDWTQLPTARLTDEQRSAWDQYRAALFDLPETTEDPAQPIWPIAPTT